MKTKMQKRLWGIKYLVIFSFIFVIFGEAVPVKASNPILYFKGPEGAVSVGDEFSIEIRVDSSQNLNAYSLFVKYPADILQVLGFNSANSIIDVQRDVPQVFEDGSIKFTGASLKPFSGQGGIISVINFKALKSGKISLIFSDVRVYLADGKGTKAVPSFKSGDIKIGEEGEIAPRKIEMNDTKSPTIVFLYLTKDPITPGRKLLSFLIRDDISGVKEVLYRAKRWFWWSEFKKAQNPTVLPLDAWAVEIKSVDNAGNATQRIVYDWGAIIAPYFLFWFAIVLAGILVINRLIRRKVYNKKSNG